MLRQGFRRLFAQEATPAPRELDLRFLEDRILYSATPLAAELLAAQSAEMAAQDGFADATGSMFLDPNAGSNASSFDGTSGPLTSVQQIEMDLRDLDTLLAQLHALDAQPAPENDAISVDASPMADSSDALVASNHDDADTESVTVDSLPSSRSHELLVIDTSLPDYEQLISSWRLDQDADSEFSVLLVDRSVDGVQFVGDYLAASDVRFDAIHLVTHGYAGGFELGRTAVNADWLAHFADQFHAWRTSLTEDADLLLYGCSIANGANGSNFLNELASLLSVDIAASTDLTGASSLGGDWELEYRVGRIDARVVMIAEDSTFYPYLLNSPPIAAPVIETFDDFNLSGWDGGNASWSSLSGWTGGYVEASNAEFGPYLTSATTRLCF